jgi:hypothetical protein
MLEYLPVRAGVGEPPEVPVMLRLQPRCRRRLLRAKVSPVMLGKTSQPDERQTMGQKKGHYRETALRWRKTKIIATLGPASNSQTMIEKMVRAGVNLVRINMSHGDQETHRATIEKVRVAAARATRHIGILMDLCGPKIRVGRFERDGIQLKAGSSVVVTTRAVTGSEGLIASQYRSLHRDVRARRSCSTTASCACGCWA